jgi:hypothetical protein
MLIGYYTIPIGYWTGMVVIGINEFYIGYGYGKNVLKVGTFGVLSKYKFSIPAIRLVLYYSCWFIFGAVD